MTVNKGFMIQSSARRCHEAQLLEENRCECIVQILRNAAFWMCLNMVSGHCVSVLARNLRGIAKFA